MSTFPTGFPPPQQDGYGLQRKPQTVESNMEVGPSFSRRISTVRRYTITVELVVTAAQVAAFQDWFDDSAGAAGGAAWFSGLALDLGDGLGVRTTAECRVVGGVYDLAPHKNTLDWSITFSVETR